MPLAPCHGPMANPHPYQFSNAYGVLNLCIDYDAAGTAAGSMEYRRDHAADAPVITLAIDGPQAAPTLHPQAARLLDVAHDEERDVLLLVLSLEFAYPELPGLPAPACGRQARYEEIRSYAFSSSDGREVLRTTATACLPAGTASTSWARLALEPGLIPPTRRYQLFVGTGTPPAVNALDFHKAADGSIRKTASFSR